MDEDTNFPDNENGLLAELRNQDKPSEPERIWPMPLDLVRLSKTEPTPPDFIINDWIPSGYAILFAGHGGAGKSSIGLHQATCIALGIPWWGHPTKQRNVLYLSCEDRADVIHWRLSRICNYLNIDIASLHGKLRILDLVGVDVILYQPGLPTKPFQGLTQALLGSEVVYADGISDVYSGDENNRAMVKQFINLMLSVIPKTGALILLGHVNKLTALTGDSSQGYSGSTGWHNSVRARWYLHAEANKEDDETPSGGLILELQKSNLGNCDQQIRFQYDESAHIFLGEQIAGVNSYDRKIQDERLQGAFMDVLSRIEADRVNNPTVYVPSNLSHGANTTWATVAAHPDWPEEFQNESIRKRFNKQVKRLQMENKISVEEVKGKTRKRYVDIWTIAPNAPNARNGKI